MAMGIRFGVFVCVFTLPFLRGWLESSEWVCVGVQTKGKNGGRELFVFLVYF